MKFFMDRNGDQYPVSEITRIGRLQGERGDKPPYKTRYHTVHVRGGERVEVPEWMVKEITSAPVMLVPAAPSTFILGDVDADDTSADDVWQTPVIAFAIGAENEVTPWTIDGPNDGVTSPGPLLMANGMVIDQGNQSYRSLDEWFQERKAEVKRAQADDGSDGSTPSSAN